MNPDEFRQKLLERYDLNSPHMAECGLQLLEVSAQAVTMVLPYREDWLGDIESGRLNPGIITVLVDSAAGAAVMAHIGSLQRIATLDLRMDYLRPAFKDREVRCRAQCYRMTETIAFVRAEVWQDDPALPIANALLVFARGSSRKESVA